MKKMILLGLLLSIVCTSGMFAAETDYLPSEEGWTEVTDLSSLALSDYYFAFYDSHDVMLGLDAGTAGKQGAASRTVWLQTPASPLEDNTKLWCLEAMTGTSGHESQYTLRSYVAKEYVMESSASSLTKFIVGTSTQANANSGVIFTYSENKSGYWTMQNGLASGNYLGPWNGGNFTAPQECAFNKSNANSYSRPTQVKIYAILRTVVDGTGGDDPEVEAVRPPLTPAWIFGHIVWEDEKNTQTAIEGLVDEYLNRDIPVHATIIDSPWSTAYNNFIWDTDRYPTHDAMIDGFNAKGVKVMLWLTSCVNTKSTGCPQDKCEEYDYAVAQNYGVNNSTPSEWWKGTGIQIDFTNPEATQWWYGQLDKVWREGVYGWKVDQGEVYFGDQVTTSIGTMTNEQFRKYYYNAMEDYIKTKTSAGANIGRPYSHQRGYHSDPAKMSMGWCGDFGGDWAGLKLQIDNIYRSAEAGYGAVGTEIAGFMGAKAGKTQFIRYAQFGAMTACMINGGENGAFSNHLPWWHGEDVVTIYRDAVKLHTSLIPYMFSTVADAHEQGGSLMKEVNLNDESHLLGNDLFTKAITSDVAIVKVTLPSGSEWIDWFTGEAFDGGKTYNLNYPLSRFPLFVRKGAIIPLYRETGKTTLRLYPATAVSEATLHLPQGDGIEYDDCVVRYDPEQTLFTIADTYSRSYVIELCGVKAVSAVEGAQSYSLNSETGVLSIEVGTTTSRTLQFNGLELADLPQGSDYPAIPAEYRSAIPTEVSEYYIYDVTSRSFLNTETRTMSDGPAALTTLTPADGKFLISGINGKYLKIGVWKGQYLWSDGDNTSTRWTIEPVEGEEAEKLFYIYTNDFTETNGEVSGKTMYLAGTNASSTKPSSAQWALISKADYAAYSTPSFDPEKVAANKTAIVDAKGDATALLQNPTFAESANGWTGGNRTSCQLYRGAGYDYESTAENATFSQTIANMPAGTYKVVAAVRGANAKTTTATARVAGIAGAAVTNNEFVASDQFNTNGVLMPKSALGGFNTARYALGWQWLTATGTLAKDGALTIEFEMTGADWKGIADVHLYYMSDGTDTYAVEYTPGVDAASHAVTCDLTVTNPNTVFTSTGAAITTISGATLNNNLVDGTIANMVLYNGYEFTAPEGEYAAKQATLFRSLPADQWCTLVVPFVPTTNLTMKTPVSLEAGTLTFGDATAASDAPMLVKSATAVTSVTGSRPAASTDALTSGQGVTMNGTYTTIDRVERGSYIVTRANGTDALYLVDSDFGMAPFRAYFTLPSDDAVKMNMLSMNFDDNETGIEKIGAVNLGQNRLHGEVYNLAGQRITNPKKGLYIINGYKVVIR